MIQIAAHAGIGHDEPAHPQQPIQRHGGAHPPPAPGRGEQRVEEHRGGQEHRQYPQLREIAGRVRGETRITASNGKIRELVLVPADVEPLPQTQEAIASADLITIGPGSLFTSLIPNLLVRGIPEAILASPAIKVFVCNLMTQANESLSLTAADHIRALNDHAGVRLFDYALINRKAASTELKAKYALEGASQIVVDMEAIEALGVCPVLGDYLEEGETARHATDRVAHDLMVLMAQAPDRQTIRSRLSSDDGSHVHG